MKELGEQTWFVGAFTVVRDRGNGQHCFMYVAQNSMDIGMTNISVKGGGPNTPE